MKMRYILLTVICILSSHYGIAQQPDGHFDEWGKVTMDEMKMTECSFDKQADAILLLDLAEVFYEKDDASAFGSGKFKITCAYYQRFKVLNEKGTSRADFKASYYLKSKENIDNIKAFCYNLEGGQIKKIALSPDDIHINKLNEYVTQVVFTVPGVKNGSVFELGYDRTQYVNYTLPNWFFTSTVASAKSSITIGFLDAIDYYVDKHITTKSFEETSVPFQSGITVPIAGGYGTKELSGKAVTYTTYNLPEYKPEQYTNSSKNYMSWVGFQLRGFSYPLNNNPNLITSFAKFNEYMYNNANFADNMDVDPISKKLWKPLISDTMGEEHKTAVIYDFIRSNLTPSNIGGINIEHNNSTIWKNKTGSPSEINLILINTLRKAGITAYPMLVGTRTGGNMNMNYPILEQFREIVALVEIDNGKKRLVVDASEKFLPLGVTKFDLLNTEGLVMKSHGDSYWYHIKDKNSDHTTVLINADLDENSRISGEITVNYNNYSANYFRHLKANGKESVISERIKKQIPNATIESISDTVVAATNKYIQTIKFSAQPLTDNDGNVYISIPAIYGNPTNPFVSAERSSDVDFGNISKETVIMNLSYPPGYVVDSLAKSIQLISRDTSISFAYQIENSANTIGLIQQLEYYSSFYKREDYPAFYDFHIRYYDLRQKPVILKKKT